MGKVIRTYFDKTPLDFLEWNGSTTSGFVTVIKLERINASARVTTRFPFITISEGDFHYFDKFKLFIGALPTFGILPKTGIPVNLVRSFTLCIDLSLYSNKRATPKLKNTPKARPTK